MRPQGLLFISHDASRTGAPCLLLHLLAWLKAHTDMGISILLGKEGVLHPEFARLGETSVYRKAKLRGNARIRSLTGVDMQKQLNSFHMDRLRQRYANRHIGLIFSNTIVNGDILDGLRVMGCPVISYVHELEYWMRHRTDPALLQSALECTDHFLAGSDAVRSNLMCNHGVSAEKITVVHDFIPVETARGKPDAMQIARIRSGLGIAENALVVGGAGTADWRKGVDVFVLLAAAIARKYTGRPVHFVWVGGGAQHGRLDELRYDAQRLGVGDALHFVETTPDYLQYLALFDMLALTSREDCFPLVMLEAALFGKPVLCFDDAGGAREFVGEDAGCIAPYLNVETMADQAAMLLSSERLRRDLGTVAREKVLRCHDIEYAAPEIYKLIMRVLAARNKEGST